MLVELYLLLKDVEQSCHQPHTVALSFLLYAAGKQQTEGEMPKIRHFHFINCSQRDNLSRFKKNLQTSETQCFWGFSFALCVRILMRIEKTRII